eukprot:GGOE01060843.1.p1 GENE.GGOE01060843.1~~GGOE01060843.1.p1  ORF type:complete len:132 (+),score=60.22 GGOE01060843.1:30-398(+)
MGKDKKKEEKPEKGAGKKPEPKADTKSKGVDSMEIRHILVEKYQPAVDIINEINSGKKTFNEAAREYSIDKAGRSGLLGWKRKNELDPDFWEAALHLEVGKYSPEPVKTVWGYHIILVQARK